MLDLSLLTFMLILLCLTLKLTTISGVNAHIVCLALILGLPLLTFMLILLCLTLKLTTLFWC